MVGRRRRSEFNAGGRSRLVAALAALYVLAPAPLAHAQSSDVVLTASPAHVTAGKALTLKAVVRAYGGFGPAAGTISFSDGGMPLGSAVLSSKGSVPLAATGTAHACMLSDGGTVVCWGANDRGQLGDGTTTNSTMPVTVSGLTNAIALTAGEAHTCALVSDGTVSCWGANAFGQLGDGTTTDSPLPLPVPGLTGILAVSSGGAHTCALTGTGTAFCLGRNDTGQLGDGTLLNRSAPVAVRGLSGIRAISAGSSHSCAVLTNNTARCWGENTNGKLGNGGTANSPLPVIVSALTDAVDVAAGGGHTCANTDTGLSVCWGTNDRGQLGNGTTTSSAVPVPVSTLTDTLVLSIGAQHSCALDGNGAVMCWGANTNGQLGDGSNTDSSTPLAIGTLGEATALSAGADFGCAVTKTATIACWGANASSQLGDGTTTDASTPITVAGSVVMGVSTGSISVSGLAVGDHTLTATFAGDANYGGSTSPGTPVTVAPIVTTATLTSSANPAKTGQSVSLRATVTGVGATPSGTVTFLEGASVLATLPLVAGKATLTKTDFAVGVHAISVSYPATGNFAGATSSTLNQSVNQGTTTTTLTASTSRAATSAPVKLTATVSAVSPAVGPVAGVVTFNDGATKLGTAALIAGKATFITSALASGDHTLTASFGATTDFAASGSAGIPLSVAPGIGVPFGVNTTTLGSQQQPAVARLAAGTFVVTWASKGEDGSGWGVYGQLHRATGGKIGTQFRANTVTTYDQLAPAIAGLADRGFVICWLAVKAPATSLGIWCQRFAANGAKVGAEFRVDTTTSPARSAPSVAGLNAGGFVVTWGESSSVDGKYDVFAQRYDKTGAKTGSAMQLNTTRMAALVSPAKSTVLTGGDFVVLWPSVPTAGALSVIKGQWVTAAGTKVRGEFTVAKSNFAQSEPSIAGSSDGGYVAVWSSPNQDGSGQGIFGRRFTATGAAAGGLFRVNTTTTNDQTQPIVAARSTGGFAVLWTSQQQDGSGRGVFARSFAATGAATSKEFRVNTATLNDQWQPTATFLSTTDYIAAWTSVGQDGSFEGLNGQRFSYTP